MVLGLKFKVSLRTFVYNSKSTTDMDMSFGYIVSLVVLSLQYRVCT